MTVSEARAALPEVLDRVGGGEEVIITRHGRPAAVVNQARHPENAQSRPRRLPRPNGYGKDSPQVVRAR
ncbi:MAG: type II toxin-antitoxin system Phd/YefM family antitoxin [Acidimicrobiales bacterium]